MDYILHIAIFVCIYAILSMSLNYIAGYTGILSVCHASFFGIGAYAFAILVRDYQVSFLLAFPAALLITGILAYLTSFPVLRLKGDSLMLISFGFALIYYNLMLNLSSVTNGALGIKGIPAFTVNGLDFSQKIPFFLLCLLLVIITFLILRKITRSPYGTIIKGIRENDTVMENMAHPTQGYKRSVFVVGAVFAALAGTLLAPYLTYIEPSLFTLHVSVLILIMTILGGFGNVAGSIAGAAVLIIFPELLRFLGLPSTIMAETQQILYGLLLFVLMFLRPQGLFGNYQL